MKTSARLLAIATLSLTAWSSYTLLTPGSSLSSLRRTQPTEMVALRPSPETAQAAPTTIAPASNPVHLHINTPVGTIRVKLREHQR